MDEPTGSSFYLSNEAFADFIGQDAPKGIPLSSYLMQRADELPPAAE